MKLLGECTVSIRIGKATGKGKIYITNLNLNLLGIDWIQDLGF